MARPITQADELILKLSKNLANKQYGDMDKRQRGVSVQMNFNVNTILIQGLRQNMEIEGLITPQERDNIINDLI